MANPFQISVDENYNPFNGGGFQDSGTNYEAPSNNNSYSSYSNPQSGSSNTGTSSTSYTAYTPPQPQASNDSGNSGYSSPASETGGYKDPITGMKYSDSDLQKREQALARREAEIANKEIQIQNGTYSKPENRKNFPPLIHIWEYYPEQDLSAPAVPMMQRIKWLYLVTILVFFANWICCLCCFAPGASEAVEPGTLIVLSSVYLFVFCPLSFECCFFVLYDALKLGKAVKFFCGIVAYIIWFLFLVLNIVGISSSGSVGFITMINLFASKSKWVGIISLVFCILGCIDAVFMVLAFITLVRFWKKEGLEKKALGEASTMAANYAKENPDLAKEALTVALNPNSSGV